MNQNLPTRADCIDAPRPCTLTACRHNLRPEQGGFSKTPYNVSQGARIVDSRPSCALDVAEQGERTAKEVADILGVTQQYVAQIEEKALIKLRKRASWGEIVDLRADFIHPKSSTYPQPIAEDQELILRARYDRRNAVRAQLKSLQKAQNLHSDEHSAHWDK